MLIRNATRTYTQLFSNLETLFAKKDVLENHYVWHLRYLGQQKSLKCFHHKNNHILHKTNSNVSAMKD